MSLFLALSDRSRRCSDLDCFLRVFCRVDNVVGRRTIDPLGKVLRPIAPPLEGLRWAFSETLSVFDREAAHMRKPQAHRNIGDALLRLGPQQRLPNLVEAGVLGIADGRDAFEGPEVLEQGSAGNTCGLDDVCNR